MRTSLVGVLALGLGLAACGGGSKKSTLPGERNLNFGPGDGEEIVVKTPKKQVTYDFEPQPVAGIIYAPQGEAGPATLIAHKAPPKGKGMDVAARRAAHGKAKGKQKVVEAEWLTIALLDAVNKKADATPDEFHAARKEALDALTAATADATAGETTWALLASMQQGLGDHVAAATTYDKLLATFPKSDKLEGYRGRKAWTSFRLGTPAARKQAAEATSGLVAKGDADALYFAGWALADAGDVAGAVDHLVKARAGLGSRPAKGVTDDVVYLMAWRGGDGAKLVADARALGGDAAAQVERLVALGELVSENGDNALAAAVMNAVVADAAATPAQLMRAYEVGSQDALAGRRLPELTTQLKGMLDRAEKFDAATAATHRERAAVIAEAVAVTLHKEWANTHEQAAAAAAQQLYAAIIAHPTLSKLVKVTDYARDLDEQLKSPEPAPAMETDKELVRRVVRLNFKGLRHCYERALINDANLAGSFTLSISPGPDGATRLVKGEAPGFPADTVTCMQRAVSTWRFPPHSPKVSITANFTFVLKPAPPTVARRHEPNSIVIALRD